MALSTTEAEYLVVVKARKEMIWMKNFLNELGMKQENILLHYDNESAIHLAKNVAYHYWIKHIQRRYNQLQEKVDEEEFPRVKIYADNNGSTCS